MKIWNEEGRLMRWIAMNRIRTHILTRFFFVYSWSFKVCGSLTLYSEPRSMFGECIVARRFYGLQRIKYKYVLRISFAGSPNDAKSYYFQVFIIILKSYSIQEFISIRFTTAFHAKPWLSGNFLVTIFKRGGYFHWLWWRRLLLPGVLTYGSIFVALLVLQRSVASIGRNTGLQCSAVAFNVGEWFCESCP